MVVREPLACSYVITLYMPTMCGSAALKPQWFIKTSIPQQVTIFAGSDLLLRTGAALVPLMQHCRHVTSLPPHRCRLHFPRKLSQPPKLLQLPCTASRGSTASASWQQQIEVNPTSSQRCQ